jgi:hypothetical protein
MAQRRADATLQASIKLQKENVHLDFYDYKTKDLQQHWEISAVLPSGERDKAIVVGGGGWADFHTTGGAFLTCSCPTRDLDGWVVASKDHAEVVDAHQLSVYLLALRIDGMLRPDLLRFVQIFSADSGSPQEHPEATVTVPNTHLVLSGGFWVDWHGEGNLATVSRPNGNGWIAKSKSHIKASPATIWAYAIGIKTMLPGAVSVAHHIDQAKSTPAAWPTMNKSLDSRFLLTGVGAEVVWNGWGNMLTRIQPSVTSNPVVQKVEASAKDHKESDPSTITVYAVGARFPDTTFNIDGMFNAGHLADYVQTLSQAGV